MSDINPIKCYIYLCNINHNILKLIIIDYAFFQMLSKCFCNNGHKFLSSIITKTIFMILRVITRVI